MLSLYSFRAIGLPIAIASALALAPAGSGQSVTLTDGTFSGWTHLNSGADTAATSSITAPSTGGNPSNYLQTTINQVNGAGVVSYAIGGSAVTYNPSTQGAFSSVSLTMDTQLLSGSQQAFGVALMQNGTIYAVSGTSNTFANDFGGSWVTHSLGSYAASSFGFVSGASTAPNPDFSSAGSAITFGLFAANSGTPNWTTISGVDNFSVTLSAVPEPSTWAAIAGAICLVGAIVVRWRRRQA